MAQWTTQIGDDAIVITNTDDGRIEIGTVSGRTIIADPEAVKDIRGKLAAAISVALGVPTDQTA